MSNAATLSISVETAWAESQAIIHNMVRKQLKKAGGDYDDFLSEAHLAFVEAWNSFDENKGTKFATWLFHKVRGRLLEHVRTRARRWGKTQADVSLDDPDACLEIGQASAPLLDILDELSDDGKLLAQLILTTPMALQADINPRSMMKSLATFMSENYGWSSIRAAITFEEMADAIR